MPTDEPKQKIPDNWDSDGLSKGKPSGPVRPTEDAYREKAKDPK